MCDKLYELIKERVQQPTYKNKISFCTDGNDQNLHSMLRNFNKDSIKYGQIIKDRINQKVVGCHKEQILGCLPYDKIAINKIDGFCSKIRERTACFVRKGKSFAKKRLHIEQILHITQTIHNLIETKQGETPAMIEGLQSKPLTWSQILHARLPYA